MKYILDPRMHILTLCMMYDIKPGCEFIVVRVILTVGMNAETRVRQRGALLTHTDGSTFCHARSKITPIHSDVNLQTHNQQSSGLVTQTPHQRTHRQDLITKELVD